MDSYRDYICDKYYWGKPWNFTNTPYVPLTPFGEEKPKEDVLRRFVVEYTHNSMVLRGNLPGFAKTSIGIFLENGKLNVVTTGGSISYSVDCSAQDYDWKRVTASYYEGFLLVEVQKHAKINKRVDVKLY